MCGGGSSGRGWCKASASGASMAGRYVAVGFYRCGGTSAQGAAPRCAVMRIGRQMRWFEGVWWRKRRRRAVIGEGFLGLQGLRVPQLKPIGIWISGVIGNRLVPARDFFLEKKQKRARCSGLPSRFILCRTCRAKAACLGGVSVCIPYAAGAACFSSTVRQIGTRLWPYACAHRGASKGSGDAMRAANAVV